MPELPEVTTIVRELHRTVRGKVIRGVATDTPKFLRPLSVVQFRAAVRGRAFLGFTRRGKFVIAALGSPRRRTPRVSRLPSPVSSYLVWHMGMTGHPLYRNPKLETQNKKLAAAMADPMNRHVQLTFHFTDGTRLEYADVRKFGKLELVQPADLTHHPQLAHLGPDALALARDPAALCARLRARRRALKVTLMDQTVVAGVGNIYADEALWVARLHPLLPTRSLTPARCHALARALRSVLTEAIRRHGTSVDDYRRLAGGKGEYGEHRRAYQRTTMPCRRCGTLIRRLVVGGRGTHICPRCQPR